MPSRSILHSQMSPLSLFTPAKVANAVNSAADVKHHAWDTEPDRAECLDAESGQGADRTANNIARYSSKTNAGRGAGPPVAGGKAVSAIPRQDLRVSSPISQFGQIAPSRSVLACSTQNQSGLHVPPFSFWIRILDRRVAPPNLPHALDEAPNRTGRRRAT